MSQDEHHQSMQCKLFYLEDLINVDVYLIVWHIVFGNAAATVQLRAFIMQSESHGAFTGLHNYSGH